MLTKFEIGFWLNFIGLWIVFIVGIYMFYKEYIRHNKTTKFKRNI